MKKITRYIDHLSGPAQTRARHQAQASLPYNNPHSPHSGVAPPSPSSPTRPESPTLTYPRLKGSLITHARRWVRKSTHRGRCMSFVRNFP
jgi:hypothetical protein